MRPSFTRCLSTCHRGVWLKQDSNIRLSTVCNVRRFRAASSQLVVSGFAYWICVHHHSRTLFSGRLAWALAAGLVVGALKELGDAFKVRAGKGGPPYHAVAEYPCLGLFAASLHDLHCSVHKPPREPHFPP
jgi:hypothetical protein